MKDLRITHVPLGEFLSTNHERPISATWSIAKIMLCLYISSVAALLECTIGFHPERG